MTAPNPGPGWQEIDAGGMPQPGQEYLHWAAGPDGPFRDWVLNPPRPLPTAAGTVIRIDGVLWTLETMGWRAAGDSGTIRAVDLEAVTVDFDVVAVPPAVTAAAVLADVRAAPNSHDVDLTPIAVAYGVALPASDG